MESKFRLLRIQLELWFDSLNIDFIDLTVLLLLSQAAEVNGACVCVDEEEQSCYCCTLVSAV